MGQMAAPLYIFRWPAMVGIPLNPMSEEKVPAVEVVTAPVASADGPAPGPPVKKKPGRPRTKPVRKPMDRNGVSATPLRPDNAIELVYDEPKAYRRALSIFN